MRSPWIISNPLCKPVFIHIASFRTTPTLYAIDSVRIKSEHSRKGVIYKNQTESGRVTMYEPTLFLRPHEISLIAMASSQDSSR